MPCLKNNLLIIFMLQRSVQLGKMANVSIVILTIISPTHPLAPHPLSSWMAFYVAHDRIFSYYLSLSIFLVSKTLAPHPTSFCIPFHFRPSQIHEYTYRNTDGNLSGFLSTISLFPHPLSQPLKRASSLQYTVHSDNTRRKQEYFVMAL